MEEKKPELEKGTYVKIKTTMGDITCRLFKDKAPKDAMDLVSKLLVYKPSARLDPLDVAFLFLFY